MGKGLLFRSATPSTQVGMVPADPYCEGSPTRFGLVWPNLMWWNTWGCVMF